MADPLRVSVHFLPSWVVPETLHGGVAVVVDVLRATSVIVKALAAGCVAVHPVGEVAEAHALAATFPPGSVLLAGERQGLPIAGFDLGNSPDEFTTERCEGRSLIMTTSNGTRAILASLPAERVLIASFGNRAAVLAALRRESRPIHVVCSGTEGEISLEDTLLAGALVDGLRSGDQGLDDPALIARSSWRSLRRDDEGPSSLVSALKRGKGGRRVLAIGLEADVLAAARIDHHGPLLPEVLRDPVRIVRAASAPS